jgi:hypothetical protein
MPRATTVLALAMQYTGSCSFQLLQRKKKAIATMRFHHQVSDRNTRNIMFECNDTQTFSFLLQDQQRLSVDQAKQLKNSTNPCGCNHTCTCLPKQLSMLWCAMCQCVYRAHNVACILLTLPVVVACHIFTQQLCHFLTSTKRHKLSLIGRVVSK